MTALAVEWEGEDEPDSDSASYISTQNLTELEFASTIQGADASCREEMDEAEIERSVREIQEAIRRKQA